MKKGDIFEGKVLRTEFPARGIVELTEQDNQGREEPKTDGMRILPGRQKFEEDSQGASSGRQETEKIKRALVKNVLPGQLVRCMVSKKKGGRLEGRLLEVLEASPIERKPACRHFGSCGGCTYQNLPYSEQLALKKEQVESLIAKNGLQFEIESIYGSPVETGYRNKMEFTFGDEFKGGPLALGMHRRGSFYDIVSLSDCRIVDPDFNVLLQIISNYFDAKRDSYYHRLRHEGFLRHLVLRRSAKTGAILVNLVTSSQDKLDGKEFVHCILEEKQAGRIDGQIAGILHTVNDSLADVVQSDETRVLYGQDYIYEYLYNLRFKITPFSFFQTNTFGAEVLYDKVREYVGDTKDKLIYDLYTGTGTIAQLLAPVAKKVIGVEIVEEAVLAARQNAKDNQLDNCEFIAGDVLKIVDELEDKPDILVLDPPRDGIHPKALKKIIGFGVQEIVYVSCKPTSLIRDLLVFRESGYHVKRACLVDMFPGTVHVETVCLLGRRKPDDTIKVSVNMDEYYQIRDAEEAEKKPS